MEGNPTVETPASAPVRGLGDRRVARLSLLDSTRCAGRAGTGVARAVPPGGVVWSARRREARGMERSVAAKVGKRLGGNPPRRSGRWMRPTREALPANRPGALLAVAAVGLFVLGTVAG